MYDLRADRGGPRQACVPAFMRLLISPVVGVLRVDVFGIRSFTKKDCKESYALISPSK